MAKPDELRAGYHLLKDLLETITRTAPCTDGVPTGFVDQQEWHYTKRGASALLGMMRQRVSRRKPK